MGIEQEFTSAGKEPPANPEAFFGFANIEAVRTVLAKLEDKLKSDITEAYSIPYLEAAAALEQFDPQEFERLGITLKQRGGNRSKWEFAVHSRSRAERDR